MTLSQDISKTLCEMEDHVDHADIGEREAESVLALEIWKHASDDAKRALADKVLTALMTKPELSDGMFSDGYGQIGYSIAHDEAERHREAITDHIKTQVRDSMREEDMAAYALQRMRKAVGVEVCNSVQEKLRQFMKTVTV